MEKQGKLQSFGVIEWNKNGDLIVEAISLKKVVLDAGTKKEIGQAVKMQHNNEIWEGQILSLHESIKAAKDSEKEILGLDKPAATVVNSKRKRTISKKLLSHESNDDSPPKKKAKSKQTSESKQKKENQVKDKKNKEEEEKKLDKEKEKKEREKKEKEKEKEKREKEKKEKEKERKAMAEKNKTLLEKMSSLTATSFRSDVVQECVKILTDPALANEMATAPQDKQLVRKIEPNLLTRPKSGGKCPRKTFEIQAYNVEPATEDEDDCENCKKLKQQIIELTRKIKSFEEQASEPPRPGKVHPMIAKRYQMVELCQGYPVFLYPTLIKQAMSKASFQATASCLLNCFYTNDELTGMNLTGANGKRCPDKDVINSIIGFVTQEKKDATIAAIKFALRNKLSSLESRARKTQQ